MAQAPRFLIDENLSVSLPPLAHARGFAAQHVNDLGLRTFKDWTLMAIIQEHGWTLVTNNVNEFEDRFKKVGVHSGIIMIVPNVARALQQRCFDLALDEVERTGDLTNRAVRVEIAGKELIVRSYGLP